MSDIEKLTPDQDRKLDAFFADARASETPVPDALLARVLADAAETQASGEDQLPSRPVRWQGLSTFFGQFGGFAGASVMTACALFGVALGYAGPDSVIDLTGLSEISAVSDLDAEVDMFEMADFSFDEGELLQ